ncbi:unnamed protein product [Coffea canephora]|uniref:NB-ARC domain-containing protein n=1 Tax=Coffea canephora TaxID=49390 RepID=A0A068UT60_COFCA|nr:unnamed protein product [Coffea canephora]
METAVESAVGFLLENLLQLIKENRDLINGAGSKVAELSDNLDLLKSFVTTYTEKHFENDILQNLAKQIRSLTHEAEDVIEEYIYCVALHKSRGRVEKFILSPAYGSSVRAVGKKIQDVSNRVKEMYQRNFLIGGEALMLEQCFNADRVDKKPKPGVPGADKVIGFEDAAAEVIERLTGKKWDQQRKTDSEQQKTEMKHMTEVKQQIELKRIEDLEVVSIVGMLGLGKTTLARKVLIDPVIEYEFFTRIFVAVSQDYEKREVLQTILVQGGFFKNITELNGKSIEELERLIGDKLKSKYLVVLDDVWTNDVWKELKPVFPDNKKGSRVLITTRHKFVAEYSKSKIRPYDLRFLFPEESRELLRTKVFDENRCPEHLEEMETNILDKCKGLPLAIVVTAGILRNNRERKEWWEKVFRGVSNLVDDDQKRSEMLIKLSYDHLPFQLKPCFLYLGVFPEDVDIPVWKLLRLWIAEGFIQHIPDTSYASLEEIAGEYLRELVDRNLVMVADRRSNDEIKTCRVHDTLRHFCKKKAIEENLFQEIKLDELIGPSASASLKNSRRLCVSAYLSDYISRTPSAPCVRSLLSLAKDESALSKEDCALIAKPFKLLKVLDVKSSKIVGRCPAELAKLVLLKYIAINCELKTLPKKMSSLLNLQTIIIDTTSSSLDIQLDLWKMTQLRHLHANASTTLPKCQEQTIMVNLQTLSTISPESCTTDVFKRTPKLKKLGIRGNIGLLVQPSRESSLSDGLLRLELLEKLKLHNDDVTCKLQALPFEHKFPAKLTRLSLQSTSLDWSHMSTLGKLKCLEVLKLKDNAFKGKHWETEDGGFRYLKVLFIGATDLKVWKAKSSNFPELKSLVLKQCRNLEAIPSDLANAKSLQVIDLEHTSQTVVASAKNMQLLQLRVLRQKRDIETSELKVKIYPPE